MPRLIPIDAGGGAAGGQILRAALALSAATGQGFEMTRIRAGRARPGLRTQHVAAVRAAALTCGARVGGVFDGSPDLRFEPNQVAPGSFRFEIASAGSAPLLLQTLLPVLATANTASRVEVTGGTHVPASPSYDYLARHWAAALAGLGLRIDLTLLRAGFDPRGGGEIHAGTFPWVRPANLTLEERGSIVAVRGVSGAARLKGDVARRQRDAAQALLWEQRRLETSWEENESIPSGTPGSFLFVEVAFEKSRACLGLLGERGVRAEVIGERLARRLLRFLDAEGAVDPQLADQLAVPLALAQGGGRITTSEVTSHLETVVAVMGVFGVRARVFGARGGPGGLEVERC